VLDQQGTGEQEAQKLEKTLSDLQAKLPAQHPRVLVLSGTPDDYSAAKPESYAGDLVRLLGGDNVAQGLDVGPLPGYTKLSLDTILAAQPDVVLVIAAWPPVPNTLAAAVREPRLGECADGEEQAGDRAQHGHLPTGGICRRLAGANLKRDRQHSAPAPHTCQVRWRPGAFPLRLHEDAPTWRA
jgi:hypothetical protein